MGACSLHKIGKNHLLELLAEKDKNRVMSQMEHVTCKQGDVLFEANKRITHVYFPLGGVVSQVVVTANGKAVEFATVGNEGMAGLSLLHGVTRYCGDVFYQVPGEALRMSASAFTAELARNARLRRILQLYAEAFFGLVAQSVACNSVHTVQQRLSRLILMSRDRVGADTIHITHVFLAQMLGLRRASVSPAASVLQREGLIRYRRGVIVVLNGRELKARSCECYSTVRRDFERLLGK